MPSPVGDEAIKIASGFGGLGGGLVFARWFISWLSGRHDRRADELRAEDSAIEQKWQRYTAMLEMRCETLEAKVTRLENQNDECHAKNRDLEARLARLEGFAGARGEIRQADQVIESARRLIDGGDL